MGFFGKNNNLPSQPSSSSGGVITSIISKDMRVTGEISFKGKARIDGVVEGNVKGEHLVLSETAKIRGDLELISLICHGSIEGNIKAQQVTTHSTASLHGNLAAGSLTVEPGAKLNGEISATSQQQVSQPPSPAASAAAKKEPEKN